MMTDILKKASRVKKRYFVDEEMWETIDRKAKYKEGKVTKKEYVY